MDYLRDLNLVSIIFRIVLAIIIGGILGIEREKKNQAAGFRTYILVCLGAAMVMMTNQYVYEIYGLGDPVRMGAQVISGIGFLGAGTIIVTGKNKIKGVTTAACLWAAACSGLAIGIGFYEGAILCGVVIVLIMSVFQSFDVWARKRSRYMDIYIEYDSAQVPFSSFLDYAKEHQFEIINFQINHDMEKNTAYTLTIASTTKRTHAEMLLVLNDATGVQYIEEL